MPQLQVLQREPDQTAAIMSKAGSDIANAYQARMERMDNLRKLDLYELQIKQSIKNTDSEVEIAKKKNTLETFKLIKEFVKEGATPEEIGSLLKDLDPDATMEAMDHIGKGLSLGRKPDEPVNPMKSIRSQLYGKAASMIPGGNVAAAPAVTLPEEVSPKGTGFEGTLFAGMAAQAARERALLASGTPTEYTKDNVKYVLPGALEAEANRAEAVKLAQNRADIASRGLGSEEQKAGANLDLLLRNTNEAILNLKGLQVNKSGRARKLDVGQTLAVDMGRPEVAGADVEPLQSNINQLKSVLLYIRSGVAVTPSEYERVSRLLQLTGKEPAQQAKDIEEFQRWAEVYLNLMKTGAPGLKELGQTGAATGGKFPWQAGKAGGIPVGRFIVEEE